MFTPHHTPTYKFLSSDMKTPPSHTYEDGEGLTGNNQQEIIQPCISLVTVGIALARSHTSQHPPPDIHYRSPRSREETRGDGRLTAEQNLHTERAAISFHFISRPSQ